MTVSRAINTPEKVAAKSLARIEQAMVELQYRKNPAARALVTKKTGLVKVVMSKELEANNPYFMTLLAGIGQELSRHLMAMLILQEPQLEVACDGMIVMGLEQGDEDLLDSLPKPLVLFGKGPDHVDWVDIDNEGSMYSVTRFLIDNGHRHLAFVGMDTKEPFMVEREQGFLRALRERDIPGTPKITRVASQVSEAKEHGIRLLRNHSVTAIVCGNDLIALGITQAAAQLGIRIPDQLSVTGFDGTSVDLMADPKLTTLRQPVFEIGMRLAQILVERLENKAPPQVSFQEVHTTELVVRDSTARAPQA